MIAAEAPVDRYEAGGTYYRDIFFYYGLLSWRFCQADIANKYWHFPFVFLARGLWRRQKHGFATAAAICANAQVQILDNASNL
jgi:hypothetical protein